jgi:hypothetical protein
LFAVTRIAIAIPLALLLAACGGGQGSSGSNSSSGEDSSGGAVATSGAQSATNPENLMDDPNNASVPLEQPRPAPTPLSAIPQPYQGRWGLVAADCDPARADNKGLMTVAADKLGFYESRATPKQVRQVGGNQIQADLDYSGEGQTWSRVATLTLEEGGRVLVREEAGETPLLRYQRCPATA